MKSIKIWLNTITKRFILVISIFAIFFIIMLSLISPTVFYNMMKPYFIQNISSVIDGSMVRQSYIWTNSRGGYELIFNPKFHYLIGEYYNDPEKQDVIRNDIESYLQSRKTAVDFKQPGAISALSHMLMATDRGDLFCIDEIRDLAEWIIATDWFQIQNMEEKSFDYSPVFQYTKDGDEFEFMCFALTHSVDDIVYTVVMATNFADIKEQFQELENLGINDYMILCNDRILYQNKEDSNINLSSYPDYMYSDVQYKPVEFDSKEGLDFMALCSFGYENMRVAIHVPKDVLLEPYLETLKIFQIFCYIIIFTIIIVVCITLKRMMSRLTRLDQQMNEVKRGNFEIILDDNRGDEITRLTHNFDHMLKTIRDDMHKLIEQEKREQQMQYSLLVSAIDPHYIYNTLDTITFLAEMGRTKDVIAVNNALIGTLKDRLKMKGYKSFDSVYVERQVLEQYLLIQNYLCHNSIELEFCVSEEDSNLQIPKNIILPLVENSIKHGILPNKGKTRKPLNGKIKIVVSDMKKTIEIRVIDNGIGMEEGILRKYQNIDNDMALKDKKHMDMEHIGIINIYMRLNYLFQNNFSFKIESEMGKGTAIVITLPKISH